MAQRKTADAQTYDFPARRQRRPDYRGHGVGAGRFHNEITRGNSLCGGKNRNPQLFSKPRGMPMRARGNGRQDILPLQVVPDMERKQTPDGAASDNADTFAFHRREFLSLWIEHFTIEMLCGVEQDETPRGAGAAAIHLRR